MSASRPLTTLLLMLAAATLSACSTSGGNKETDEGTTPARELYYEAKAELDGSGYDQAIDKFETLEARYPFGKYAQQAQLQTAYAHYKNRETDAAIAAADRFIKLNPKHPQVPYAHYLKGLANYHRGETFINFLLPRNPAEKDPTPLRKAFDSFSILAKNYPDSRYTPDARQRMVYLRNQLAKHEMNVADFYMRRGAYVAAVNRCQYVMEHYQGAESMPRALDMMASGYRKLGLDTLAADTVQVRNTNYPGIKPGDCEPSVKDRLTGFFGGPASTCGHPQIASNTAPQGATRDGQKVKSNNCDVGLTDRMLALVGAKTLYCEAQ